MLAGLKTADIDRIPVFTETSSENAIQFYRQFNFEIVDKYFVARRSPATWTMLRTPPKPGRVVKSRVPRSGAFCIGIVQRYSVAEAKSMSDSKLQSVGTELDDTERECLITLSRDADELLARYCDDAKLRANPSARRSAFAAFEATRAMSDTRRY